MRTRKYGNGAKYPIILDEFAASGEPLRIIECGDYKRACYVCSKAFRGRYHAELRGILVIHRNTTVYLVNPFASCMKKVEV